MDIAVAIKRHEMERQRLIEKGKDSVVIPEIERHFAITGVFIEAMQGSIEAVREKDLGSMELDCLLAKMQETVDSVSRANKAIIEILIPALKAGNLETLQVIGMQLEVEEDILKLAYNMNCCADLKYVSSPLPVQLEIDEQTQKKLDALCCGNSARYLH